MEKQRLAHYRKLLEERAEELEKLNTMTESDTDPVMLDQSSVGRLSRMDSLQRQAMSEETRRRRMQELVRIEAAFQRLGEDEYGYCLACGEPIGEARLALDPATPHCIDHA
jgi:DnaK suppressor protein